MGPKPKIVDVITVQLEQPGHLCLATCITTGIQAQGEDVPATLRALADQLDQVDAEAQS